MTAVDAPSVREYACFYRSLGYQPLPSDPTRKKPLVKFGQWWEAEAPADLFRRFPGCNVQLMCGSRWGLAVVDLDGPDAVAFFAREWGPHLPRGHWRVHHADARKSMHLWFSTPPGLPGTRKKVLWLNPEEDHSAVELLCDRSLVVAPPSVHPKSGARYRFVRGHSPRDFARPAVLPGWFWELPAVARPRPDAPPQADASRRPAPAPGPRVDGRHLLTVITDKRAVAASWGLRFAASPSESEGWVSVHDYNRDDFNPSARFHLGSGSFWRPGERVMSLFDLGAAMGAYADWRECRDALAAEFLPTNRKA